MLNLLIVDDNLYFAKTIINIISKSDNNFKLCTISTNGQEALEELSNNIFDIILLDLKLPKHNGIEILEILSTRYKNEYENSVIVVSNQCELLSKIHKNCCLFSYVNKTNGIDYIINDIEKLVEFKNSTKSEKLLRKSIENELIKIRYNFSYLGTKYLIETLTIILKKGNFDSINLKKIFSVVAKRYNKTISNIKININNATEIMFYDCEQEILDKYFGYRITSKPKTKFIILTILQKIYLESKL